VLCCGQLQSTILHGAHVARHFRIPKPTLIPYLTPIMRLSLPLADTMTLT